MSVFPERRRKSLPPELLIRVLVAWLVISAVLVVTNIGSILAMRFPDPDDTLRLIQVRDLIAGQGWYDLVQHRIDAPRGGVAMHWSRLVDIPLAAIILLFQPLIGQPAAEAVAAVTVPLLTLGVALLLIGRVVWRLVGDEAAGLACLALALSVPVVSQVMPLRVDHHGWQIVAALAAVNGLMARRVRLGGWVTGFSLAVWMAISIEGLPMAAVFCGIAALRWLRDRSGAEWFVATMQSLAATSALLFLATRGLGATEQFCDAVSPFHLAIFGTGALGATLLARLEPMPRMTLLVGLGIIAAAAVAILWSAAPQCLNGGFGTMDLIVVHHWYNGVGEGLPIWQQSPGTVVQIAIPPIIGLFACLQLAGRTGGWLKRWWLEYAALLFCALLVAVFVSRAGAVAGALAAVPLGWQIREWMRGARNIRRPGKKALAMVAITLALLPAFPLTLFAFAMPAQAAIGEPRARMSTCEIPISSAALRALPQGEVFAPLDIGPGLLYETSHTVVATGHHRGEAGMREVIETFIGNAADARATLHQRGSDYLALCPDLAEPARYAAAAPDGFAARLLRGETPAWLEPVAVPGDGSLKVWRVVR